MQKPYSLHSLPQAHAQHLHLPLIRIELVLSHRFGSSVHDETPHVHDTHFDLYHNPLYTPQVPAQHLWKGVSDTKRDLEDTAVQEVVCLYEQDAIPFDTDVEGDVGEKDGDGLGVYLSVGLEDGNATADPAAVGDVPTGLVAGKDIGIDMLTYLEGKTEEVETRET